MNLSHQDRPLSLGQSLALRVLFSLPFSAGVGFWGSFLPSALKNPTFSEFDILTIAIALILSVMVFVAYFRGMRWIAIRELPPEQRPAVGKGPIWIEKIQGSQHLAWIMIAYSSLSYLVTLVGIIIAILWGRSDHRFSPDYLGFTIQIVFTLWIAASWGLGVWLFQTLSRRWYLAQAPLPTTASMSVDRLWDRDLDHDFAGEPRRVS